MKTKLKGDRKRLKRKRITAKRKLIMSVQHNVHTMRMRAAFTNDALIHTRQIQHMTSIFFACLCFHLVQLWRENKTQTCNVVSVCKSSAIFRKTKLGMTEKKSTWGSRTRMAEIRVALVLRAGSALSKPVLGGLWSVVWSSRVWAEDWHVSYRDQRINTQYWYSYNCCCCCCCWWWWWMMMIRLWQGFSLLLSYTRQW